MTANTTSTMTQQQQYRRLNSVWYFRAANNCANSFKKLKRFEEAKALLRSTVHVARRVLGENDDLTLRMRWNYAQTLYEDPGATLDDLRKSVTTFEGIEQIARRVFGSSHPITTAFEENLQDARAALRAREAPPSSSGGA